MSSVDVHHVAERFGRDVVLSLGEGDPGIGEDDGALTGHPHGVRTAFDRVPPRDKGDLPSSRPVFGTSILLQFLSHD